MSQNEHTQHPRLDFSLPLSFLSPLDTRPARTQFDENYAHGGGWRPQEGFTMDPSTKQLLYRGDPPLNPQGFTTLREELIIFYDFSYVAIVQPDDSFEVSRMD